MGTVEHKKKDVLILAGGDIRNKFSYIKNNCSSPALIPVNTKPIIAYILDWYKSSQDFRVFLIIDEKAQKEVTSEISNLLHASNTEVICVANCENVNQTLASGLEQIKALSSEVIVNVVTTIPTVTPKKSEVVIGNTNSSNSNWSIITDTGAFISKNDAQKIIGKPFTGLFSVDSELLLVNVQKCLRSSDLMDVVIAMDKSSKLDTIEADWIDCGHEENYYSAKRSLINSRSFNKLRVTKDGRILKSSTNKQKLKQEVYFAKELPPRIGHLAPRVLYVQESEHEYKYAMEYYGYPNVAELCLYWEVQPYVWKNLFQQIKSALKKFNKERVHFSKDQHVTFYRNKLKNRIDTFKRQLGADNPLFESNYIINGLPCKSLAELWPAIEHRIVQLYNPDHFGVMHGDLCFNNILYDFPNDIVKFIDARGQYAGETTIYGDLKYDLAKLVHSSIYGYDYIVNDLYKNVTHGTEVNIEFNLRDNHELLEQHSLKLLKDFEIAESDIVFIVGLLFLSMTPLHSDSVQRQKTMYLHGLKLVNQTAHEPATNLS